MTADEQAISVPVGSKVVFRWNNHHDVVELSKTAYQTCDIASATVLSGAHDHDHHGHEHRLLAARRLAETYTLEVGNTAGTRYISCSVGTHCAQDQKVVITVTNSTSAASSDCSVSSSQGKNIAHSVAFLLPATLAASLWLLGEQQAGGAA